MFDVTATIKGQGATDAPKTETQHLRSPDGGPVGMRDLLLHCYKLFTRRKNPVEEVTVIQYVPRVVKVAVDDDGNLCMDGRVFDMATIMAMPADAEVAVVSIPAGAQAFGNNGGAAPVVAAPQTPDVPGQPVIIAAPPQASTPVAAGSPASQRLDITDQMSKRDRAKLDIDERRYEPSPEERASGIRRVAVLTHGRQMRYEAPWRSARLLGLPFPTGSVFTLYEKVRKPNAQNEIKTYWRVPYAGRSYLVPDEAMNAVPEGTQDSFLDLQMERPDNRQQVAADPEGNPLGDVAALNGGGGGQGDVVENVPLQVGVDRRPARQSAPAAVPMEIPELRKGA